MPSASRWIGRGPASVLALVLVSSVLVGGASSSAAAETYFPSPAGSLTLTGHGNGHGKGMSQYGARGMAVQGKSYKEILGFYYPHSDDGTAPKGVTLRVYLKDVDEDINTMIEPQPGQKITVSSIGYDRTPDADPAPFTLPTTIGGKPVKYWIADREAKGATGTARLLYTTSDAPMAFQTYYTDEKKTKPYETTNSIRFTNQDPDGTLRLIVPQPFLWGYDYHGYLESVYAGKAAQGDKVPAMTINGVDLEQYLGGVVPREMPSSWPTEALKAQAVAARTYAYKQYTVGGAKATFNLQDGQSSQVYRGVQQYNASGNPTDLHEQASTNAAIAATPGQIRTYGGGPITAMFSSSNGGYSTGGGAGYPYLPAQADPYDAYDNKYSTWTRDIASSTIASKYGVGTLKRITIDSRDGNGQWDGRVLKMTIEGSTKTVTNVSGDDFRSKLGLPSTWWTTGSAPGAPAAVSAAGKNGYATVSWAPPSSDGGKAITGYTVTVTPGGQKLSLAKDARSVTVPNLDNGTTYTFSVTATNEVGTSQAATAKATPTLVTSAFHAAGPKRVFDSRDARATLGAGTVREVRVAGGSTGIPSGVNGVALNVTVTNTTATSFLTVYSKMQARPTASNVNWTAGQTVPNLVSVPVAPDGTIELYNEAGRADVIVDVFGYYTAATASDHGDVLRAETPRRIFDTRTGKGGPKAKLGAGQSRNLVVAGDNGVPSNATAVVANLTATNVSAASFLTAWPAGTARPGTSSLNMARGQTRANAVVLPLGTNGSNKGKLSIYNDQGSADVIVDVLGWYVPASSADAPGQFAPVQPARLLDTRTALGGHHGRLGRGDMQLQVTGRGGVPASGVSAVALNVTAVNPSAATFVTAYPAGSGRPLASNVNAPARTTIANMVIVPVGSGGKINLYNDAGSTDLVVDVLGWYSS